MKLKTKSLALLIALAVIVISSGRPVAAAPTGGDNAAVYVTDGCGDLPLDEQYACRYGGWQPTAPAVGHASDVNDACAGLPMDQFYACRSTGWQPEPDEPVRSR